MTSTKPIEASDDCAIVGELLRLRDAGAPKWLRLYVNNDTSTILIRLAGRAHLEAWRTAAESTADIAVEHFPESGLDYHSVDLRDWQPQWKVVMTARVDYPASTSTSTQKPTVPARREDPLTDAVRTPSFRAKRAAHRMPVADIHPAVSP